MQQYAAYGYILGIGIGQIGKAKELSSFAR
jgi:hypothetical protein